MNYTVIFAGGVGARMGSAVPKQFLEVGGKPIIIHTVEHFDRHPEIDGIVIVSKEEYIGLCRDLVRQFQIHKVLDVIPGGETGQMSIFNGLDYLYTHVSKAPDEDVALMHDGVRPLIDEKLITDSIRCARENGNSIAVAKAIETVIRVDAEGIVLDAVDRSECRNAKAPQCFMLGEIWRTHKRAQRDGHYNMIDSATLMSSYGTRLFTVDCKQENIKVTTPNDYYMFKAIYEARENEEVL